MDAEVSVGVEVVVLGGHVLCSRSGGGGALPNLRHLKAEIYTHISSIGFGRTKRHVLTELTLDLGLQIVH